MVGKEILTLQFGHYSNFVGTHWWNIQEQGFEYNSNIPSEINHDVLYREGLSPRGEVTFTPRLLLVDLKGSLKTLPEIGELYERLPHPSEVKVEWDENLVETRPGPSEVKNKFQADLEDPEKLQSVSKESYDFDKDARVWSDFLYTRFHPRTVNIVKEYQHCNENTPFDAFPLGASLWKTPQFEEDFSDKIRNYIEECDGFQGFHVLTDCTNAFGGLTSSCMEHLQDDYGRKSILVFPVIPSHFPDNEYQTEEEKLQSVIIDSVRMLNVALSFNEFTENSSLLVPLSVGSTGWRQPGLKREFRNVVYDPKLPYHSSALLATALETFSMKYRLKSSGFALADLSADLNQGGRKVAAASLCLPFPLKEGGDLLECLDKWEGPLFQSITPNCTIGNYRVMQHVALRGIAEERLKKPLNQAQKQRELPAYRCDSIEEMLTLFLSYTSEATASNVTVVHKPLDVRNPFPRIFNRNIGQNGCVSEFERADGIGVEKVPVLSGLHTGSEVGQMLENLHTEARKIKVARFHQFASEGIQKDDFEECLDNLFALRENYEDSYVI
nr:protein misato [Leptinotarsa decemlineata]